MNSCILSLVEEYEQYSSLYDEEAQYYFESLFENDGTPMIFCDMMGMPSYLQDIPVTEYVQLMVKQSQNTTVIIKDVRKGNATFRNGEWFVPVFFRKSISYIDQGGYVFSVNDYYDTDFDMVMNLRYDPDAGRCFIRSITGSLTADKEFPKGRFMIIDKSSEEGFQYARYMESLTVGGKALDYNEFGQAMFSYGEAQVDDPDVEVHPETRFEGYNYDVVSFRFTPRNTRVRLRYGYAPFAYSLEGLGNDVNHQSNAMEIGTDIGIAFRSGARSKMSLNIGLGISMSNLSLSYSPMYPRVYTYKFLQSPQNGIYSVGTVDYEVKSASEAMRYIDVFVPVYFEVEHNVDPRVIISWNMGFKGYYGLSASVVNPYEIKATASINGAQPKPVTLMSTNGEGTSFIEANTYAKNDFEVAAMVNLGLDINVYKKKLYAMLRVGYEYGLSSYLSTTNKYMSGRPLVYDPVSAQHIAVNSMISGISFNRSSLWISAGIKFKM
ncbi:MAG: hypothetical protein J6A22_07270 [Bacteroidales bacterium]|nr:hypothetical protein [Bacteroidales bacterium]